MATPRPQPTTSLSLAQCIARAKRRPVRISATVSASAYERLQLLADEQGRSLSNLTAYLVESGLAALGPALSVKPSSERPLRLPSA